MRTRIVVAVVAALAVVTGCSTTDTLSPEADPKDVARAIDPARATVLKIGEDLPVVAELPTTLGRRKVYFDGFADDNTLFGSMSLPEPPSDAIPSRVESRGYPFLYDLRTQKFTVLDESRRSVVPYVADIVASADAVVWLEGHGVAMGTDDFEIRAFNRSNGTVTKLGRFTDTSGNVMYADDLLLHDGTAYFSTRAFNHKKTSRSAVHSVSVDGSKPLKVLVPDAEDVSLEGDSITYEQKKARQSLDLATSVVTPVPVNPFADDPGFCGGGTVETAEYWCIGVPAVHDGDINFYDPVLTFKEPSGRTTTIATPTDDDTGGFPVPHGLQDYGEWIGFTVRGGNWPAPQFLIDLEAGTSRRMPQDTMLTQTSPENTLAPVFEVTGEDTPARVVKLPQA